MRRYFRSRDTVTELSGRGVFFGAIWLPPDVIRFCDLATAAVELPLWLLRISG